MPSLPSQYEWIRDKRKLKRIISQKGIPDRLIAAIQVAPLIDPHKINMWVRCGGRISSPAPSLHNPRPKASMTQPPRKLARSELEALELLVTGHTVKMLAYQLGISSRVAEKRLEMARFRMNALNNEQLIYRAIQHGILSARMGAPMAISESSLTPRALETLRLVAEGWTNSEIAKLQYVSEETIKTRLKFLFAHFGAKNRASLVANAMRSGVIE